MVCRSRGNRGGIEQEPHGPQRRDAPYRGRSGNLRGARRRRAARPASRRRCCRWRSAIFCIEGACGARSRLIRGQWPQAQAAVDAYARPLDRQRRRIRLVADAARRSCSTWRGRSISARATGSNSTMAATSGWAPPPSRCIEIAADEPLRPLAHRLAYRQPAHAAEIATAGCGCAPTMSRRRWSRGWAAHRLVRCAVRPGNRRLCRRGAGHDQAATDTTRSARCLYRLLAWLSPSFPTGAFSYSHGLEAAVAAGACGRRASARRLGRGDRRPRQRPNGRRRARLSPRRWRRQGADTPTGALAVRATAELALEAPSRGDSGDGAPGHPPSSRAAQDGAAAPCSTSCRGRHARASSYAATNAISAIAASAGGGAAPGPPSASARLSPGLRRQSGLGRPPARRHWPDRRAAHSRGAGAGRRHRRRRR